MSVSLVVLRLELADHSLPLKEFSYNSDTYFDSKETGETVEKVNDLSFTLQSEEIEVPSNFKEIPSLHHGKRVYREYIIETYYQTMEVDDETHFSTHSTASTEMTYSEVASADMSKLHRSKSESSETGTKSKSPLTIQYFSGNPMVEVTKGIMHIFKDKYLTSLDADTPRSEMICMLGIPAKYNCQDLQKYIAPARDTIRHIQIIRDSIPNQYMVLIRFKDQQSADEFYNEYQRKNYNMLESEFSHLVYVSRIEHTKSEQGGYLPISGLTELPTCSVCLERMDESVEGILTVLCNHSFHNECLIKWQDSCCPVCRYCQTPEPSVDQKCSECESTESLWICLICGHVGCGRYQEQHAFQHYQQTAHTFSMQLGNQRVWDYTGDNYVHRLIQSKGDGKLVSLDNSEMVDGEKVDSLTLEYTYLLTNQLESQRQYFEKKIDFIENDAHDKLLLMENSLQQKTQDYQSMHQKYLNSEKERKAAERKYENTVSKVGNLSRELRDEKQMNKCLRENQVDFQQKFEEYEKKYSQLEKEKAMEIMELQAQVSDLMKHLEVQSAVSNAEQGIKQDIQGGQVFVEQSPSKSGAKLKTKGKKK